MQNELSQGYFAYWQNRFIHHNILTIGYTAWNGYVNAGKGMVVCDVVDTIPPSINWNVDTVTFNRAFVTVRSLILSGSEELMRVRERNRAIGNSSSIFR